VTQSDSLDPLRGELETYIRAIDKEDKATPECLDDEILAALAEGTLSPAAREAALRHLAFCARCRRAVGSIARALADPSVAREISAIEHPGRRRLLQFVLPAAAAALLVLVAGPLLKEVRVHRGPTVPAQATPVPLAPIGAVTQARALQWGRVAGADRYRATLFAADGQVLYETEVADTLAALPDSLVLRPGPAYLWKVEARTGWNRWTASELTRFTIAGGGSP